MGISTDGQISYGIKLDDDFTPPWDEEKHDYDIETWWVDINYRENPIPCPYDEKGDRKEGSTDQQADKWHENRKKWLEKHPLLVQPVNYCSDGYPEYIIAVKSLTANRGHPKEINVSFFTITPQETENLHNFMNKILPNTEYDDPKWWLSSHYGT